MRKSTPKRSSSIPRMSKKGVKTAAQCRLDTFQTALSNKPVVVKFQNFKMMLPQERHVLSEIFVIVRRFSQKLQAHKLNMIRGKSWLDTLEQYGGFVRVTVVKRTRIPRQNGDGRGIASARFV